VKSIAADAGPRPDASTAAPVPTTSGARLGDRALRRAAAAFAIVAVLEDAAIFVMGLRGDPRFPIGFDLVTFGMFATITAFTLVGAAIVLRRPRTRVAWAMIGMGISLGTGAFLAAYGALFTATTGVNEAPLAFEAVVLSSIFFVPALGFGTSSLLLLYPTDRLLGPRWRVVLWLSLLGTIAWNVGVLLRPGNIDHETLGHLPNPLAAPVELAPLLDALAGLGSLSTIVTIAIAGASLFVRYRRGDSVIRAQIRWFGLIAVVVVVALMLAIVLDPNGQPFFDVGIVALAFLPLAIWIAISRYRLYDIDLIINRALVYGSLTAILAGTFAAGVGLAQRLFVAVTGQSSDAAIVLCTLVVATLYAPLRKRLEAIIDKRFKYETRRFGSYGDKVKSVLAVIDPKRAAEALSGEAVSELSAVGAAVLDDSGAVLGSAGTWPLPPGSEGTTVALADRGPIRSIVVGAARNGREHADRDLGALEEVGRLTAQAVARG
jgi:hypothetical protein